MGVEGLGTINHKHSPLFPTGIQLQSHAATNPEDAAVLIRHGVEKSADRVHSVDTTDETRSRIPGKVE